jgi:hypothetical protein
MKPLGSLTRKARSWYVWGDKIPKKFRRYFNKAVRAMFKRKDKNDI